jgi:hypothetical protein
VARFVRGAERTTEDKGLWNAQLRLAELAYALRDLDAGRVAPALRPTKRKGNSPDSSRLWMKRVCVLVAMDALQKSGLKQGAAARHIDKTYPELRRLMTRGKDLPDAILRWRRELEEAKQGKFLATFARQKIDMNEDVRNMSAHRKMKADDWRQFADNMLTRIRP